MVLMMSNLTMEYIVNYFKDIVKGNKPAKFIVKTTIYMKYFK